MTMRSDRHWWMWAATMALLCLVTGEATAQLQVQVQQAGRARLIARPTTEAPTLGDPVEKLPKQAVKRFGEPMAARSGFGRVVQFSNNSKLVAVGDTRGVVTLIDAKQDKVLAQLKGQSGSTMSLAFSPDDKTLVSAGTASNIYFWDVEKHKLKKSVPCRARYVEALRYSPDGKLLVAGGRSGNVRIAVMKADGTHLRDIKNNNKAVVSIAFSPDGKTLAAGGYDKQIRFYDPASGEKKYKEYGTPSYVYGMAFHPTDGKLIVGFQTSGLHVVDVEKNKRERALPGHSSGVAVVSISADGKTFATRSYDNTTKVWDYASGKATKTFKHSPPGSTYFNSMALSPDGTRLAAVRRDTLLDLWGLPDGERVLEKPGHYGAVRKVVFSGDGKLVASSGDDGSVRIWDIASGKQLHQFESPMGSPSTLAFVGDTLQTGTADYREARLLNYHAGTGKQTASANLSHTGVRAIGFSPDGAVLATAGTDRVLRLWRGQTGKAIRSIEGFASYPGAMAFDGNATRLAVVENNGVEVYRTSDGSQIGRVQVNGVNYSRSSVAFSQDGRVLAATDYTRRLYLYETSSFNQIMTMESDGASTSSYNHYNATVSGRDVVFSPTASNIIATSGPKETVELWDIATGKKIASYRGHSGTVECMAFSDDGKLLVTGSEDSTIVVWQTPEVQAPSTDLSKKETVDLWNQLASSSGREAYDAIRRLAAAPKDAVALLDEKLKPASVDNDRIIALIKQLDSDDYQTRERASMDLEKYGRLARPSLAATLKVTTSEEVRWRIQTLLEVADEPKVSNTQILRTLRAVHVLELIGNDDAKVLLGKLAGGAPQAVLTEEAGRVLKRLQARDSES